MSEVAVTFFVSFVRIPGCIIAVIMSKHVFIMESFFFSFRKFCRHHSKFSPYVLFPDELHSAPHTLQVSDVVGRL
jgi:hypothetical protein